MIITTKRTEVLRRVPPGDRWSPVDDPNVVFDSLTKGLEHIFQATNQREFHLSPLEGFIYSVEEVEAEEIHDEPQEPEKFDLYGEK
tara:strand:- start:125 stop:382 length:258 start_codon:yes stop_codon:yes gene_type:complete